MDADKQTSRFGIALAAALAGSMLIAVAVLAHAVANLQVFA